ncbi:hypothetical protein B0H21DRAFT_825717 [Amylocystis lapponica]|nr:hypothetical protein B0H21DRAFT_825717 [Amylocystis lapponica]
MSNNVYRAGLPPALSHDGAAQPEDAELTEKRGSVTLLTAFEEDEAENVGLARLPRMGEARAYHYEWLLKDWVEGFQSVIDTREWGGKLVKQMGFERMAVVQELEEQLRRASERGQVQGERLEALATEYNARRVAVVQELEGRLRKASEREQAQEVRMEFLTRECAEKCARERGERMHAESEAALEEMLRLHAEENIARLQRDYDALMRAISVIQWLLNAETSHPTSSSPHRLTRFFTTLRAALRNPSRTVLQFYPTSDDQVRLITSIAQKAGFGVVVVDCPNSNKARKVFLCLFTDHTPREKLLLVVQTFLRQELFMQTAS